MVFFLRAVDREIGYKSSQIKDYEIAICYLSTISTQQCQQRMVGSAS
jgi:hypothetical protein